MAPASRRNTNAVINADEKCLAYGLLPDLTGCQCDLQFVGLYFPEGRHFVEHILVATFLRQQCGRWLADASPVSRRRVSGAVVASEGWRGRGLICCCVRQAVIAGDSCIYLCHGCAPAQLTPKVFGLRQDRDWPQCRCRPSTRSRGILVRAFSCGAMPVWGKEKGGPWSASFVDAKLIPCWLQTPGQKFTSAAR